MDNRYGSPDVINDAVHALQAIGKLIDVDLDVFKASQIYKGGAASNRTLIHVTST